MNGYGRRGYPMPQGGAGYNPYSKYPDIAGLAQQFMQNMMMMRQLKGQKEQQTWQRGMREKEFELKERQAEQVQPTKPPTLPARVQEAIWATGQADVPPEERDYGLIGKKLDEWRDRPEKKEEEDTTRADTYTRHQNLLKSALTRLGKERTTLNQRSRPSQSELESGIMPERKKAFMDESKNVEDALNLLSKMESFMESGAPLSKRQESALKKIIGNIGGVRSGKTVEDIRTSWAKELEPTPQAPRRKQFRNKKTGKLDWFTLKDGKWIKE